jgi:hypothetical protein
MSTMIAAAPAHIVHMDSRSPQRDQLTTDLMRYVQILTGRFTRHRPGDDPQNCRCGRTRPCSEEWQIACLLELAGDACR